MNLPEFEVYELSNNEQFQIISLGYLDMTEYLNAYRSLKNDGLNPVKFGLDKQTDRYILQFTIEHVKEEPYIPKFMLN